jgi:hypothetical protein
MSKTEARRFFFVHIMKTGGATFRQHVYANFGEGEVYPVPKVEDMDRAWLVDYVLGLPEARRNRFRAYAGHFPFVVTELLPGDFVTMTIVRDPVARTISYLKHCKRYHDHHRDLSLDEIYQDTFHFDCFIHNHQTKIFSMRVGDKLESYMDRIDVDEERLELAKANLEKIDVLGLNEHYPAFLDQLRDRYGWRFDQVHNRRVSREKKWVASPELRVRIAEDNAIDMAFYEHAARVYERRRQSQAVS